MCGLPETLAQMCATERRDFAVFACERTLRLDIVASAQKPLQRTSAEGLLAASAGPVVEFFTALFLFACGSLERRPHGCNQSTREVWIVDSCGQKIKLVGDVLRRPQARPAVTARGRISLCSLQLSEKTAA